MNNSISGNNSSSLIQEQAEILQRSNIFKSLEVSDICNILMNVHHQIKSYKKGELIAGSGDTCGSLRIILQGSVVGEMTDFQGKSLRIEELKAPDTIASAFLFGDDNTMPVDAIAREETQILLIHKNDLTSLFIKNEIILKNYLDIISNRAQKLSKKIKLLGLQSIRGKFSNYLLEQVKREGKMEFELKNSQSELANMFGITRPSLARVIRDLHNKGVIIAKGKKVVILNKKALSEFLK